MAFTRDFYQGQQPLCARFRDRGKCSGNGAWKFSAQCNKSAAPAAKCRHCQALFASQRVVDGVRQRMSRQQIFCSVKSSLKLIGIDSPMVGNVDATRRHLRGDSRESSGASLVLAERSRSGNSGASVHGAAGSARTVRNSAGPSTLTRNDMVAGLARLFHNQAINQAGTGRVNASDFRDLGRALTDAIERTVSQMMQERAQGPWIMGRGRATGNSGWGPRSTLATRGNSSRDHDRGMDQFLEARLSRRKRKHTDRPIPTAPDYVLSDSAHITFEDGWAADPNAWNSDGELRRPGLSGRAAELDDDEGTGATNPSAQEPDGGQAARGPPRGAR